MPTSESLTQKISSKIEQIKPIPKWRFNLLLALAVFGIVAMVTASVFSLTFFVWDLVRFTGDFRPNPGSIVQLIQLSLLELILIASLCGLVIYRLMRTFDIDFVKNRLQVVIAIMMVIVGLVAGSFLVAFNHPPLRRFFNRAEDRFQEIPHRKNRRLPPPRDFQRDQQRPPQSPPRER